MKKGEKMKDDNEERRIMMEKGESRKGKR